MFDYLEKLAEKDVTFDDVKKDVFYKLVIDTSAKWKQFEVRYRSIKSLINRDLRDSLIKMDDKKKFIITPPKEVTDFFDLARKQVKDSLKIKSDDTIPLGTKFPSLPPEVSKKMDSVSQISIKNKRKDFCKNVEIVLKMIDTFDFPDENILGVSKTDYRCYFISNILQNYSKIQFFNGRTVEPTLGNDSHSLPYQDIEYLLLKAIRNGKIDPKAALNAFDKVISEDVRNSEKIRLVKVKLEENVLCDDKIWEGRKDKWLFTKAVFENYSIVQMDEKRKQISLESLDDLYRKVIFCNKMPFFQLNNRDLSKEYTYASSCEMVEQLVKNTVITEN